jgi:dipeptidyl aminopeptidase/acylaminoacyl peptidase
LELYLRSTGGAGDEQSLLAETDARAVALGYANLIPTDWSPDGQYVAFASGAPADVWVLAVGDRQSPTRLTRSRLDQMHANFSPDGRFIAYTSNESGRHDVYIETLPQSDRKWPISINGGYEPRWRSDGREIYYLSLDRTLMAVPVTSGAKPFGVPRPVFQTDVHAGVNVLRTHYVPNRDGTRFLVHTRSRDLAPVPITVVVNWTAALQQ